MRSGNANADIMEYRRREDPIPLEQSKKENNIGIVIDEKLSFDQHINEKVNMANTILGVIRRSFEKLDARTFRLLYVSLVRYHSEFTNAVLNPYKIKHRLDMIENMQRHATKLVPGIKTLDYKNKLKELKLSTLSHRLMRGDLIEVYKLSSDDLKNWFNTAIPT